MDYSKGLKRITYTLITLEIVIIIISGLIHEDVSDVIKSALIITMVSLIPLLLFILMITWVIRGFLKSKGIGFDRSIIATWVMWFNFIVIVRESAGFTPIETFMISTITPLFIVLLLKFIQNGFRKKIIKKEKNSKSTL